MRWTGAVALRIGAGKLFDGDSPTFAIDHVRCPGLVSIERDGRNAGGCLTGQPHAAKSDIFFDREHGVPHVWHFVQFTSGRIGLFTRSEYIFDADAGCLNDAAKDRRVIVIVKKNGISIERTRTRDC